MNSQVLLITCLLVILEIFLTVSSHNEGGQSVQSPMGTIKGSIMKSRRGRTIYAFRGIPYAQQPVGELRFKPPQPLTHYNETVDATKSGPACPQPAIFMHGWKNFSEDCLRLNVYTTELPQRRHNSQKPILVFFHSGAFYLGSGISALAGPEHLLDHNITLVTVNYRLGTLGFISTGTKEAPGNNGFKDQVEALRWIQKNIASFGGNPDSVTIFGCSAGSISVALHMMSPMSKGLFHRAIAMSGAAIGNIKLPTHQLYLAEKQARLLNCSTISPKAILDCLMTKSSVELGDSFLRLNKTTYDPGWLLEPIIEPDFGQERFLTNDPNELVKNGNFCSVPFLSGITDLELTGHALKLLMGKAVIKEYQKNWEKIAPITFIYERDTENSKFISRELRKFYFADKPLEYNNETIFALGRLYSDRIISFGTNRFANLMAQKSKYPVYFYKFSYKGRYSNFYYPGTQQPIGPIHEDDLLYLFNVSLVFPSISLHAPESFMVDRLTTLWTNFVIYGDPTPNDTNPVIENLKWPRLTEKDKFYVDIGDHLVVKQELFKERFQLWERLFPL